MIDVRHGDMLTILPTLAENSVSSCCTDPPYGLNFMGRRWDRDVAFRVETWAEVFRVMKPGGHLLAFGGTRTFHRLACAIEDAGFELRDTIAWVYAQGFPKSLDIGKAIDRAAGVEREVVGRRTDRAATPKQDIRGGNLMNGINGGIDCSAITAPATDAARQWSGWGTAIKPSMELVCVARKPLSERNVSANVLKHGTGGLNIDGCRIGTTKRVPGFLGTTANKVYGAGLGGYAQDGTEGGHDPNLGRWPANVVHDGSDEVLLGFPETASGSRHGEYANGTFSGGTVTRELNGDSGSAARFFKECRFSENEKRFHYDSKADAGDRADSRHPCVKPVSLMRWLVRLVTPPGGTVLDPFAGSGTTGEAAMREGFDALLIEREAEHAADIEHRIGRWSGVDLPLFAS